MAERSTAAVDVADNDGDEPSAAQAAKATSDGVDTQNGRAADGPMPDKDGERKNTASTAAPELHSGHKLARRYRLEECVTRVDGFSSWRAMDEKLRRAVGVHLMPADHSRARSVLAAARSSALLGDPRFVQVLDAVEENDLVYVVHEWLPDATELTALLAAGPLEAHEAYQLVSQVSQAMAAAHREGLAHLRLTPSAILRTSTGQWRIRGLAVNAALRGITSETPQRADTEAIGALLYAALTQRWPYESDAYGLTGLPKGVGLIAPDQVRAGVHRGLGGGGGGGPPPPRRVLKKKSPPHTKKKKDGGGGGVLG
ncbi:protein kinase family protein, partial [Streptomyces amritsarensis]|uniref:protein kinase family protein n=1 Tax=Streptomyces amritsarensis TaxID=681158 RepID=UPI00368ACAFA